LAVYQKGLVPLLIQASPHHCLLLFAIEAGDLLDLVKTAYFHCNWSKNEAKQILSTLPRILTESGKFSASITKNNKLVVRYGRLTHYLTDYFVIISRISLLL
ncbi:hypothetical protein DWX80_06845, partial [Ruminococcus sp. AF21-3]